MANIYYKGSIRIIDVTMTRQRQIYETAFDCLVNKTDDLNELDRLSNHPCLIEFNEIHPTSDIVSILTQKNNQKSIKEICCDNKSISILSEKLKGIHVERTKVSSAVDGVSLTQMKYKLSPPSTVPLPAKFHGKESTTSSIYSAPSLCICQKSKSKILHLPIKPLVIQNSSSTFGSVESKYNYYETESCRDRKCAVNEDQNVNRRLEMKGKQVEHFVGDKLQLKKLSRKIVDIKSRKHKFSSSESTITSSSAESIESVKSSTSEGNRSTTSSGSRHSLSLSSHESEFGDRNSFSVALKLHVNKLNILSPISDKSLQEPVFETSDNQNNTTQNCSVNDIIVSENMRCRLPQNKNQSDLNVLLGETEIQESDSGISVHSREEGRKHNLISINSPTNYLKELPFDMPKLKRKFNVQQSFTEPNLSHTSSSQSITLSINEDRNFKSKLGLNLDSCVRKRRVNLELPLKNLNDVDMNLPLEKQGWFHGTISRIDAEQVLQDVKEGSFLVRNSRPCIWSYYLSLKSTRGFLHVRIQKVHEQFYTLGNTIEKFKTVPELINYFSMNPLPIPGAEHVFLTQPIILPFL